MRLFHLVPLLGVPALFAGGDAERMTASFLPPVEQSAMMSCTSCYNTGDEHMFHWMGLDYVKCEDVGCHSTTRPGTCRGEHQDEGCISLDLLEELENDLPTMDAAGLAARIASEPSLRYSAVSGHLEVRDCEGVVVAYFPVFIEDPAQITVGME